MCIACAVNATFILSFKYVQLQDDTLEIRPLPYHCALCMSGEFLAKCKLRKSAFPW